MSSVTDEQLAEWARLAEEATPGPWVLLAGWEQDDPGHYVAADSPSCSSLVYSSDSIMSEADLRLMAAAREAVPALVARVRELEARVAEMERWRR